MHLIIDIGNTRTKIAIFKKSRLLLLEILEKVSKEKIKKILNRFPGIHSGIISSVTQIREDVNRFVKLNTAHFIHLNYSTRLPVQIKYKTSRTLGNDRIANAVGAQAVYPGKNVLVIDAGTCLKFDFVDEKKNYSGGAISPGMLMRYKALHDYTEKLPLIKPSKKFSLTGKSTAESIRSGVQNGMLMEMQGIIEQYKKKYTNLQIILTGGDALFFANQLKSSIFAAPNLTLTGLNEILKYNVLQDA